MSPKSRYSVAGVILLLTGVRVLGKNYNLTIGPTMTIASDEMSAYALIDEYNAGNWLAKFDVLQVSGNRFTSELQLTSYADLGPNSFVALPASSSIVFPD